MVAWTSKLGGKYSKHEIEDAHKETMKQLTALRNLGPNRLCADCGRQGTLWCSLNLGVFTCMKCGSFHRALGTHVSIPKGCTGTYLWGPDELQRMREMGNFKAKLLYGGDEHRPAIDASDGVWLNYIRDKYEHRKWANKADSETPNQKKKITLTPAKPPNQKRQPSPTADYDLLDLKSLDTAVATKGPSQEDFFAQFGA